MESKSFLNIAAGKLKPIGFNEENLDLLLNVDTSYFKKNLVFDNNDPGIFEAKYKQWKEVSNGYYDKHYLNIDIFEFMERTTCTFDNVSCYRFLEHVHRDKVLYFIYLVSTVMEPGGLFDIIVPNYTKLADMILNDDDPFSVRFNEKNILLTTELLNEPESPHCSIWTIKRLNYFLQLENRFRVKECCEYAFDGRDIYLRCIAERI